MNEESAEFIENFEEIKTNDNKKGYNKKDKKRKGPREEKEFLDWDLYQQLSEEVESPTKKNEGPSIEKKRNRTEICGNYGQIMGKNG